MTSHSMIDENIPILRPNIYSTRAENHHAKTAKQGSAAERCAMSRAIHPREASRQVPPNILQLSDKNSAPTRKKRSSRHCAQQCHRIPKTKVSPHRMSPSSCRRLDRTNGVTHEAPSQPRAGLYVDESAQRELAACKCERAH